MTNTAGKYFFHLDLLGFCWNFHIFPREEFRMWGLEENWYDGPMYDFGLGPLLLVCLADEECVHRREK